MSENNATDCNAGKRLPEEALKTLMKEAGQTVHDQLEVSQTFYGDQTKHQHFSWVTDFYLSELTVLPSHYSWTEVSIALL